MTIPVQDQNIIALLGIESLPDERKVEIINRVTELVQKRLLLRVLDLATPEQRQELKSLLEREDQAGLQAYLDGNVPQLAEWMDEELSIVKQELAGWVNDILKE